MSNINVAELAVEIVKQGRQLDSANILMGVMGNSRPISKISIKDMTTALSRDSAKTYGAVKCIFVSDASDRNAYIWIIIGKRDDRNVTPIKMSRSENRVITIEPAESEFSIFYDTQPGKTIELTYSQFVTTSSKDLDTLSVISTGSTRTLITPVNIPVISGTPALLLPADADRLESIICPSVDSYLLSASTDTPTDGIPIIANERYTDTNKGALYIIAQDIVAGKCTGLIHK